MTFTITLTLGQRLRYARERAGLDQSDLEPVVLTTRQAISSWENDKARPHALKLRAFAEACNVPVDFFDGETATFSMVPDGGSPLAGVGASSADTKAVTRRYLATAQASVLPVAA